jgi:uncharacterized protein (DUF486 family)
MPPRLVLFPLRCHISAVEITPDKIADLRVKHLEMLQTIVGRMAAYGATLKNYCLTVTTAACGFGVTLQRPLVALVALLPIIIFASLDAQYLRVERRFRSLFEQFRQEAWSTMPTFEISLKTAPKIRYWNVVVSWSIINFYAPLLVGVGVVVLISGCVYGRFI